MRHRTEVTKRWSGDQVRLDAKGVVDCGVGGEEPLGGALRLEFLLLSFAPSDGGYCQVNLPGSQKPFPHPDVHAAVVAAAHV